MHMTRVAAAIAACLVAQTATAKPFDFTREWTFTHPAASVSTAQGAEIVSWDALSRQLWVVGTDARLGDAAVGRSGIDIPALDGSFVASIDLQSVGGVNSGAIRNGIAGVAITAPVKTDPGLLHVYDTATRGLVTSVAVGANPDMVTFTADGSRLLVANEGEPRDFTLGLAGDAEGSVSIVDAATFAVTTAGFAGFDAAALKAAGVRLFGPNQTAPLNLEPEYIAVSADGRTAAVTLQENNAIAFVDLDTQQVTGIKALGLKDHSLPGNGLDVSDRDGAGNNPLNGNIQNWKVQGMYLPDAIAGEFALIAAALPPEPPPSMQDSPPVDAEAAEAVLGELEELLLRSDARALALCAKEDATLRAALGAGQPALARHVQNFEFDEALDVLRAARPAR